MNINLLNIYKSTNDLLDKNKVTNIHSKANHHSPHSSHHDMVEIWGIEPQTFHRKVNINLLNIYKSTNDLLDKK